MAIINCPNCGGQIPEGSRFCGGCGATVPFNPAPEAQAYRPNLVKPNVPQAPAQPQYYAPPQGYQQPVYQQNPVYAANFSLTKKERISFSISFLLVAAGFILYLLNYLIWADWDTEYLWDLLASNIIYYMMSVSIPVMLFLMVRNENRKSVRKAAFTLSIVVLALQLIFCLVHLGYTINYEPVPYTVYQVCGSWLFSAMLDLFDIFESTFFWIMLSLTNILSSACLVAKNVIVCITLGRIAKR